MDSKLTDTVLKQIDVLEQELAKLKKDIIHSLAAKEKSKKKKPSLFGSVKGEDITEAIIAESKRNLFRNLPDV